MGSAAGGEGGGASRRAAPCWSGCRGACPTGSQGRQSHAEHTDRSTFTEDVRKKTQDVLSEEGAGLEETPS